MLRVAVDATSLLVHPTGVGVFTGEVLAGLARRASAERLDVTAYAVSWRGRHRLGEVVPAGVRTVTRPMAARPLREAWRRFDLPPIEWWTGAVDVVHGTNYVVPPSRHAAEIVSVHDLTPVHFPELSTADTLQYPGLVRRAVRRGAWVLTPSEFIAAEVRTWLADDGRSNPDRVVAVHYGVTPMSGGDAERGREIAGVGPGERYVLALGTVEPRKDLPTLVAAFDRLAGEPAHTGLRLVVAGPDGWGVGAFDDALAAAHHRDRIHRLGWVPGGARPDLLAGAAVVAYPSLYEGFGFIPLEAMSAGTPVVCSDAGPLPEVVGEAAATVAPRDIDALAGALHDVLTDDDLAARLVAAGKVRVAGFSWDRCVDGVVDLYRRATAVS